jgi:hypothetical protein
MGTTVLPFLHVDRSEIINDDFYYVIVEDKTLKVNIKNNVPSNPDISEPTLPWVDGTEGLKYTLSSDKTYYSVSGYTDLPDEVTVAAIYNELPVKRIANNAFVGCLTLKHITLPSTIVEIGDYAFSDCSSLTDISLSNSNLIHIGESAFINCVSLTNVIIPDSVLTLDKSVFYRCSKLETLIIGNSATCTSTHLCHGCAGLKNVVLGDSITNIEMQ